MVVADQVAVIYAATNGYIDRIEVGRVPEFHNGLVQRLRSEPGELMVRIAGGAWDDDVQGALDRAVKEYADDFGFDLDEDGQPLEAGDSDRVRGGRGDGNGAAATTGAQQDGQGERQQPAGAVSALESAAV